MKAKELRIGNLVYDVYNEEDDRKVSMVEYEDFAVFKDYIESGESIDTIIQPIPLTEEWLEKFGLTDIRHGTTLFYSSNRVYPYTDLYITETKEGWYLTENSDDYIMGEPFNHVHQLQNLYFALTGEELTIDK